MNADVPTQLFRLGTLLQERRMNAPIAWLRSAGAVSMAWGCGDMLCQTMEQKAWERERTAQCMIVGLTIMGPVSHGFELVNERLFPGSAVRAVIQKVLTRVVCAPGFLSLSFGGLAFMRGHDIIDAVTSNVVPAWCTGTMFWPAVAAFSYRFIPVVSRPAFGSCVGALWSTYISFRAHAVR